MTATRTDDDDDRPDDKRWIGGQSQNFGDSKERRKKKMLRKWKLMKRKVDFSEKKEKRAEGEKEDGVLDEPEELVSGPKREKKMSSDKIANQRKRYRLLRCGFGVVGQPDQKCEVEISKSTTAREKDEMVSRLGRKESGRQQSSGQFYVVAGKGESSLSHDGVVVHNRSWSEGENARKGGEAPMNVEIVKWRE